MADLSHGGGRVPKEVRVKPETAHEALFSILPALVEPDLHGRWLRNARSEAGSQILRTQSVQRICTAGSAKPQQR